MHEMCTSDGKTDLVSHVVDVHSHISMSIMKPQNIHKQVGLQRQHLLQEAFQLRKQDFAALVLFMFLLMGFSFLLGFVSFADQPAL